MPPYGPVYALIRAISGFHETLTLKTRPSTKLTFLVKMSFICMRIKIQCTGNSGLNTCKHKQQVKH